MVDRSTGNIFNVNKEQKPVGITRRLFRPYSQYKDSGVEWLGKIPAHWEVKRIKNIARLHTGGTPPGLLDEAFEEEGIPWVKPEQLQGDCGIAPPDRKLSYNAAKSLGIVIEGSALVCGIGTVGKTGHAPFEVCTNQQINSITFGSKVIIRYGQFAAVCLEREFARRSNKVTIAICNKSAMGEAPICIPLAKEQFSIAAFLDRETEKIDALIEKKERLIELLQEKRSALITQAVTKGLDPIVPMKDSGIEWLGKIPAHWEVKRLKRSFRVINGSTPASGESTYWDGDIPWVTPEDLGDLTGVTIYTTRRRITETGYRSCGTTVVPADSLVLSTRAPIGHLAIAGVDLCTNQGCKSLVFRRSSPRKYWFFLILVARKELKSLGQGSTFRELSSSKLEALSITEPQPAEQRAIAAFLDRETAKIDTLVAKVRGAISSLKEYRTALISAAVIGKIDVRDAS